MGTLRWPVGLLAVLLLAALLSGCSLRRDPREALVQQAIKADMAGDFDGLRALYTPEHREFLSPKGTLGAVYRSDAGGQTPEIRHLAANTVFNGNGRAVVLASFEFYDQSKNHYVVAATYDLTEYARRWYILSYDAKKHQIP